MPDLELTVKQAERSRIMTLADRIREFVNEHYVQPARKRGNQTFIIRAGDVHDDMGLDSRLPA